ncbi:MAG: polyphosphate--glucose phosphotransferase [Anaerolineales bacterium]
MQILGIDIGGSGVKGAPIDINTGEFAAERFRIPMPQPAKPEAVIECIQEIVNAFEWKGPIGCGFPGVIKQGVVLTAANVDDSWIGYDLQQVLETRIGQPVRVLNDADAAGVAEMQFGAGRGRKGLVMIVTLGTGIGTAGFIDGRLIPNLELGHIEIKGKDAEDKAANSAREDEDLSWKKWAKRVDRYLYRLELLVWPDLYIIGGGVSKKFDKFVPRFKKTSVEVVPAQLRNHAGIVGAALASVSALEAR